MGSRVRGGGRKSAIKPRQLPITGSAHNEERFSLASRRTRAPIEPPAAEGATVS